MLVLTRKPGESVIVDGNIVITVSEVRGDNVKIAIDAPKEIKIFRNEIFEAIVKENQNAMMDTEVDPGQLFAKLNIKGKQEKI